MKGVLCSLGWHSWDKWVYYERKYVNGISKRPTKVERRRLRTCKGCGIEQEHIVGIDERSGL